MDCPDCGGPNSPGQRFCGHCGHQLLALCAACGAGNPMGQRFCGDCGQSLTADSAPSAEPPTPVPPPAESSLPPGERRHATVLFSDLCGYTAMAERLDPEEVQEVMRRIKAEAVRIVEGYGGSVNQFVGDEVLALFGIPVAHKDDPVRAVRAALELHGFVAGLSPEIEGRLGRAIRLHSGLATGLIVTSRSDDRDGRVGITGDTVNTGARLKQLAPDDTILVSPETRKWVLDEFALEPEAAVPLKGKSASLIPYRVTGPLGGGPARSRPFVGRQAELRQFAGAAEACSGSGHGQVIVLRGDPGIGKTRLAGEFRRTARTLGFAVHEAAALDFGAGRGGDPVRALVQGLLGLSAGSDGGVREAASATAIAEGLVEPEQEPFLLDLLGLPQPERLRANYDAMDNEHRNRQKRATMRRLVQTRAATAPLLLVVEDVHWADRLTLAHLAELAMATADDPLLLVLTTRLAGDPLDLAWRQTAKGAAVTTIDVMALHADEALALARSYLEVTAQTAESCVSRAEGNPLFLEQLLLNAEESAETAIPGSVQSLVLARVDHLPPAERRALQVASVLGQRFDPVAVRHLIDDANYDFGRLAAQSLIRPEDTGYLFAHALVRDGVYESLLHATRRELHAGAAEWYRERDPVLHADHLALASDPTAAAAYLSAARAEADALHFERALELVERGSALEADAAVACGLLLEKGHLQRELGALRDSIASYERAVGLAPSDHARCLAWVGVAQGGRLADDYGLGLKALDRAEPLADTLGDPELQSQVHYLRGCLYFGTGQPSECLAAHERAMAIARDARLVEAEIRALGGLSDGYYIVRRVRDYYAAVCECVDLAARSGFPRIEAANRLSKAYHDRFQIGTEQALAEMQLGFAQAEEFGLMRSATLAEICMGLLLADLARLDEAEALGRRRYEEACSLGMPRMAGVAANVLAIVAYRSGRSEDAYNLAKTSVEIHATSGAVQFEAIACGIAALTAPNFDVAAEHLATGQAMLDQGRPLANHYEYPRYAIEALLRFQRWDDAIRLADEFDRANPQEQTPWESFFARWGRALAAAGMGRQDPGLASELDELIEFAERWGLMVAIPPLRDAVRTVTDREASA